jgi:1,4-dihydroxy-2-naphthoyl-CoA synthase
MSELISQRVKRVQNQSEWKSIAKFEDILLEKTIDGVAKVTINRPEV